MELSAVKFLAMPVHETFRFDYAARSPRALAMVVAVLGLLAAMWIFLGAAWWIVLPLTALTLPALYDIGRNHRASLEVDATHLSWTRGPESIQIPLSEIEDVRIKLGLDFSQKITLYRRGDAPLRIPLECIPRGRGLSDALSERGVQVARNFFV